MSIRLKLFLALALVVGLAGGLAFYAVNQVPAAGGLLVKLYDGPLTGVNYAGSAHAALNEARGLMQSGLTLREDLPADFADKVETSVKTVSEDLAVVRERVDDPSVRDALDRADVALAAWLKSGMLIIKSQKGGITELPMGSTVLALGAAAAAAVDDVVEFTAAYGFNFRQQAETGVAAARKTVIVLASIIGGCGLLLAFGFAYSLGRPIRTPIRISERVTTRDLT